MFLVTPGEKGKIKGKAGASQEENDAESLQPPPQLNQELRRGWGQKAREARTKH